MGRWSKIIVGGFMVLGLLVGQTGRAEAGCCGVMQCTKRDANDIVDQYSVGCSTISAAGSCNNAACPSDYVKDFDCEWVSSGSCGGGTGTGCTSNSQCPSGQCCRNGVCSTNCEGPTCNSSTRSGVNLTQSSIPC